jgi:DNA-3-methyladenine glycosylase I
MFHNWGIEKISTMTDTELENILLDPGIIRNRLKVYSVRKNAIAALQIIDEFGSLDNYFWSSGFCYVE